MRTGLTISAAGHAAVLLWSVLTFVISPHQVDSGETLPVDVISTSEFSQITNGVKDSPKTEQPKPLAEKVAAASPVDDPAAKLGQKEVKAATDAPPVPPIPEAKPPEPKVKKPAQPQPDLIGEALKHDEDKRPEPKRAEVKPPPPTPVPKKPAPPEPPKFDPRKVAALLDKREPQRVAAAGETLNNTPQLGLAGGNANQLSLYEMDALRARLSQLWSPPAGARELRDLSVTIRVRFKPDGTLDGQPQLMSSGNGPLFMAASESAMRAILRGQPFTMLRPEHYEVWSEMDITFDQSMMLGG
jgi:outer membrane biosynthesis protein TonB